MSYTVLLVYPVLIVFLCYKAKIYGPGKWNEEFMSLEQSKAFQGFAAICIMLHHCGLKTCSADMEPEYIIHGLDVFVPVGYLCVSVFLFCSGYGLYKSVKTKENYLNTFWEKRILPIVFTLLVTSFIFAAVRSGRDDNIWFGNPFTFGGPDTLNPYSWYVWAFLVFNIGFYFAFRYIKKESVAIAVTTIVVILYMVHCNLWVYGTWWMNTALLFVVGIVFARHEKSIVERMKRYYVIFIIVTLLITAAAFVLGEYTYSVLPQIDRITACDMVWYVRLGAQIIAGIGFTIMILLLGLKIRIGNKALKFMGNITLEFYLLHGIFVQIFAYCFLWILLKPVYYIKDVGLYVLVVLLLSLPCAYILKKLSKIFLAYLMKNDYIDFIVYGAKRLLVVLAVGIVVVTCYATVTSRDTTRDMEQAVKAYADDNLVSADVDGQKMSAYVTGKGAHTLVLLGEEKNPCPSLTFKETADYLGKNNRVIVLDYLGNGYSDEPKTDRILEQYVYEIHSALKSLGESGPYILMAQGEAGLYARYYMDAYADEVEGYIGIGAYAPMYLEERLTLQHSRLEEYMRTAKRRGKYANIMQRVSNALGYVRFQFPSFQEMSSGQLSEKERAVLCELYIKNFNSKTDAVSIGNEYRNFYKIRKEKLPENMPVLLTMSESEDSEWLYKGVDWNQLYEETITNPDIQKIQVIKGGPNYIYAMPDKVDMAVRKFIESNYK